MSLPTPRLPIRHNSPIIPLAHRIHNLPHALKHLGLARLRPVNGVIRERFGRAVVPHVGCRVGRAAVEDGDVGAVDLEDGGGGALEFAGVEGADSEEDADGWVFFHCDCSAAVIEGVELL